MNQREFWDWFHKEFSKKVANAVAEAEAQPMVSKIVCNHYKLDNDVDTWLAAVRYTDILEQCRTLIGYEGTCYSYMNFKCILEGWAKDNFFPDLLQWVENDMKKQGCWNGQIEEK